ncbi:TRAP transporter substrate-binding protein [Pseudogemmobacter sonorensis]|uniref:TRAP transporter substrate-binding protein n=1 Tax=Pseudogemmobacter sonorensis TaxID=2989681 RepID=UPI0036B6FD50
MKKEALHLALLGAAMACLATQAAAQDKIKLRVAGFLPATHFQVPNGSNVWMDEVKRLTGDRVEFEYYPAEQMGKAASLMELLQAGVIDVAEIAPAYVTEKLPLIGVLEMPGLVPDSCSGAKALRALAEPGGTIYESDFKPNRVRPLTFFIYPAYKVVTASKAIEKGEDFQGMKLRTSGGVAALVTSKLGGVAVPMPWPEVYQSLSRGTLDGVFSSFVGIEEADLHSITKYGMLGYNFGTPSVIISMSDQKLNSLPEDVRNALVQAGTVADESFCSYVNENEELTIQKLGEEALTLVTFSDEEKSRMDETLASISQEWAASLDGRGRPGTKVLEEFRQQLGTAH